MNNRPNIVFLFPDQLRRDFLSCYGAGFIQTPNVDWIAEQGNPVRTMRILGVRRSACPPGRRC